MSADESGVIKSSEFSVTSENFSSNEVVRSLPPGVKLYAKLIISRREDNVFKQFNSSIRDSLAIAVNFSP
ncbi:uncharacterized protein H6S33_008825 [Morchella sextelata]|uniref:uncharacterized protein n=1 Tax=Morchella sextelata TaxID=1174677 RepID=UPI001D03B632|nr:uncharacterized protein H6S33_008825 [Morchella sextelata]KAH0602350.1 hypothetical protein H6S33_008825 [Morchella sextelata]